MSENDRPAAIRAKTPWPRGAILICRTCDGPGAKGMRKRLKSLLEAAGLKKTLRPLVTSCQDLCPRDGTAVSVVLADGALVTYVVRAESELDAIVARVP